jgi:four helix bundle protein
MDEVTFKKRTKRLALDVIKLIDAMPGTIASEIVARQVARSSTSVGANYRAACRAKSIKDMIYKLKIVEEESDETVFWLELIVESGLLPESRTKDISKEASEILAMTVASINTLRKRKW